MMKGILDNIIEDLLSTPPIIDRNVRRKLLKTAITSLNEDISPLPFAVIKLLGEAGSLHIAEIGERLQIARPQMTHLIDKLAALDIVERRTGTVDRRTIDITLTNKGKTLSEKYDSLIRKTILETMSSLSMGELQELSTSLRKLREIFTKLKYPG
ncbi:MarR family winged helix-turn-helix transcriptional regulator [Chloroflexota bacterium]